MNLFVSIFGGILLTAILFGLARSLKLSNFWAAVIAAAAATTEAAVIVAATTEAAATTSTTSGVEEESLRDDRINDELQLIMSSLAAQAASSEKARS